MWGNIPYDMSAQQRLWLACLSAQYGQSVLSPWRNLSCSAIQSRPSEDSDQTVQKHSLIWIFPGHSCRKVRLQMWLLYDLGIVIGFITPFYTTPRDSSWVLWLHVGHSCVCPSVCPGEWMGFYVASDYWRFQCLSGIYSSSYLEFSFMWQKCILCGYFLAKNSHISMLK